MNEERPGGRQSTEELTPRQLLHQLIGGDARWVFTVLAALSLVAFALTLTDPEIATYFPLRLTGATAIVVVSVATLIWCALAAVNWRNWRRR